MSTRLFALFAMVAVVCETAAGAEYLDPLGPPGSDATRMPTLGQIEPRQVIDSLPFVITNSGSYVITRNLESPPGGDGITIQTNGVTIDLNGFSMKGFAGCGHGIVVDGNRTFIVIKNGVINRWDKNGIKADAANNSKIEDLLVSGNMQSGASLGTNCVVLRCTAADNSGTGFSVGSDGVIMDSMAKGNSGVGFDAGPGCVLQRCVADKNTSHGFNVAFMGQISSCTASDNGGGNGFNLQTSCSVLDSCAYNNFHGFFGWDGIVFSRCVAYSNQVGLYAAKSCTFSDCSAYANTIQGMYGDRGCSFQQCTALGNAMGIGGRLGCKISSCTATLNREEGFWLGWSTRLEGCTSSENSNGVSMQTGCMIKDNIFSENTYSAILANNGCTIKDNHIALCGTGVELTGVDNVLSGNVVLNNTQDYNISGDENSLDLLISKVPLTISWPAKAKLTGTLAGVSSADGITIAANNVTVDLDGHGLVGVPGSYHGISVLSGCANVEIKNGIVSDWGRSGIVATDASQVTVMGIKASRDGLEGNYDGISLGTTSTVRSCEAVANGRAGIRTRAGSTVDQCVSDGNGNDGIQVVSGCTVTASSCNNNGDDGIQPEGAGNTIDGNIVKGNNWAGIYDIPGGSIIIRNRASGNKKYNYTIAGNSTFGPIFQGPGVITNMNAWANLEF